MDPLGGLGYDPPDTAFRFIMALGDVAAERKKASRRINLVSLPTLEGLYRDNGKENGNYYIMIRLPYYNIVVSIFFSIIPI